MIPAPKAPNKFTFTNTIFYQPAFPQRGTLVDSGNESNCSLLALQAALCNILGLLVHSAAPGLQGQAKSERRYLSQVKGGADLWPRRQRTLLKKKRRLRYLSSFCLQISRNALIYPVASGSRFRAQTQ